MIDPNGTPTEPATTHDAVSAAFDSLSNSTPDAPQAAPEPQAPVYEAPQHWPEPDRQRFAQAAPEWQQWILDRNKSTEADYTRKTQELAAQRKQLEQSEQYAQQVRQLYEPLKQYGWDERTTAQWAHALATNPQGTLAELQKLYGGQQTQPGEFIDPELQRVQTQLQNLSSWQQQQQQLQQAYFQKLQEAQQTQEIDSYWQQWSSQKDDKGAPKFPHFSNDEVRQTMGALLSSFPDRYTEDQAYALAVQAHIKPESITPKSDPARVANARAAGFSVQSGTPAPRQIHSTRDAVSAAFDQLTNR